MACLIERRNRILQSVPHLATASGSIASFSTDMRSPLEELKIHFNPVQASGTPSPQNVLPITGWTSCDLWKTGKNILHKVGYSATTISSPTANRNISNRYGTTLNTINPDESVTITQSQAPDSTKYSYKNGYAVVVEDSLIFGQRYAVSFRLLNVTNNPLNASITDIKIGSPYGSTYGATETVGDKFCCNNFYYRQREMLPNQHGIEIYICGMSCTISDFMVTPIADTDTTYASFVGNQIPVSWSDTVYGGWVDAVRGEGEITWELASGRWGNIKTGNPDATTGYYEGILNFTNKIVVLHYASDYGVNTISNTIPTIYWTGAGRTPEHYYGGNANNKGKCFIYGNFDDDLVIQIAAKLADPISFSVTPITLKSLRGQNNIWSSANGDVDVRYWTH